MQLHTSLRTQTGFSLIEVMIALFLAGLVTTVLAASFMQSIYTQRLLAARAAIVVLAQGKLAELTVGSEQASSGEFPKPYSKYHWRSREETDNANNHFIILTIDWREGNVSPHQIIYKSYLRPE